MREEVAISVAGGLNTDDSLLNSGNTFLTDYLYARNVRIGSSVENNTGAAETIPSSLLINNYYAWNGSAFVSTGAPSGNFTCIGKREDKANGKVYYCCYNDAGNHVILMFDKVERKIYQMLQWSGLNFSLQYPVQMTQINKYILFVDGANNPPRMFDSTDIYKLKQTLGSNFSEYHLTFAKWAPLAPPRVIRSSATASNDLKKGVRQFTYRYVYKGGFRSTFAPPSVFVTNEITESDYNFELYIPGFIFDYETPASEAFNHNSIKFYEWVEYIELAVRESELDGWKIWQRYEVSSGSNNSFTYSNNGAIARVSQSEIAQYFDSVPFKSGTVDAIDNRPMFADNLDDFQPISVTISNVEVYSANRDAVSNSWIGPSTAFSSLNASAQDVLSRFRSICIMSFKERGIYKLGIIYQHWSGRTSLVVSPDNWVYKIPATEAQDSAKIYALGFTLSGTPPEEAVAYQIVRTNCLNISAFIYGEINNFQFIKDDDSAVTDNVSTPEAVQTIINDFNNNDPEFTSQLDIAKRIIQSIRKTQAAGSFLAAGYVFIDIRNWYLPPLRTTGTSTPANNVFYSYRQGDRVRFWGSTATNAITPLQQFDAEIIAFTGNAIIIKKPSDLLTLKTRSEAPNIETWYRIEIYREADFNLEDDVVFYEMGEWYPVLNPTTPSRAYSKTDFRWTNPASVTETQVAGHSVLSKMPISNGDVWVVSKQFFYKGVGTAFTGTSVLNVWMQMNQDQEQAALTPWNHNVGRPLAAYKYVPVNQQKEGQVRFGGKFLEDSIFININTMRDEWQFIYPSEYGRIRRLVNTNNAQVESVGNILLAFGEEEVWSIYVNRATLEDISGRTQVSISDKVLGSYNTLLGSFGTLNPESITVEDGKVIWWSEKKGSWARYARDGITNISSRKMRNWFKDLSELIRNSYATSTPAKVISTYDEYHDRWILRIDHSSLPSTFKGYSGYKCTTFSEEDGRWKEHLEIAPDQFASIDTEVYGIYGRTIRIFEAGADYLNFEGSTVVPQIELVLNTEPRAVKDCRNVALDATDKWSFESIKGDWKSNSATIQETRIPLASLESKEGVYWAEIKRDKNSPNAASQTAGVVSGNPIKTRTLRALIQLDPLVTWLSVFNWLIVTYDKSPKNPKN